jgi:hypothetical protein
MPDVTHFPARRDALQPSGEGQGWGNEPRPCNGCGTHFHPQRPWQKHCNHRCRQRAYVQRRSVTPMGYYGA